MRFTPVVVALAVVASAACNPFAPSEYYGHFRWTVDGQPFEASPNGRVALPVSNSLSLAGATCAEGGSLNIYFPGPLAPGTYDVASGIMATWTPDARTGTAATTNFEARPGLGGGTLTLTTVTSGKAAGRFTFGMIGGSGTRAVAGEFDLELADRTVC